MDGHSSNFREDEDQLGAIDHLLYRMNSQFALSEECRQYHSGYVPNPPWPHHLQEDLYYNPMNSTVRRSPLGSQVGLSPLPHFSRNSESYNDSEMGHSPLLRSSSDHGQRLQQISQQSQTFFKNIPFNDIVMQRDSSNPNIYYNDHSLPPHLQSSIYHHPPPPLPQASYCNSLQSSKNKIHNANYDVSNGSARQSKNLNSDLHESSSNLSNKLSNFTASLGTWFSPLDQAIKNSSDNLKAGSSQIIHDKIPNNLQNGFKESVHHSVPANLQTDLYFDSSKPQVPSKLSYSDVLSKGSCQDAKLNSQSSPRNHKGKSFTQSSSLLSSTSKNREVSQKFGNKRSKNKNHSSSNVGRNSPNFIANLTNSDYLNNTKNVSKADMHSSIGLDDFDILSDVNSNSSVIFDDEDGSAKFDISEKSKKRHSISSDDPSPVHQIKKGNKVDGKKINDKLSDSFTDQDLYWDKLNNYGSSSQQKQTPK